MRNIKPCPRPQRFPAVDRTLNSAKAPITVWFNHAALVKSSELTAVRVRTIIGDDSCIVVEIKRGTGEAIELLRVPRTFGYLVEVSR